MSLVLLLLACVAGVAPKDDPDGNTDGGGDTDGRGGDPLDDESGADTTDLPDWVDPTATRPLLVELCDTPEGDPSYLELANPTTGPLDLDGWSVRRFTGIDRMPVDSSSLDDLRIPAGGLLVLTRDKSDLPRAWGKGAVAEITALGGDGYDAYGLYLDEDLVDLYGALGVDGKRQPWKYHDTCSVRSREASKPKRAWDRTEWTVSVTPGPFAR